ncbi:MAG TPA: Na+/H+ antiporter subunit D [Acidimicrobiales bacterium]|nr:Na+/H+ antiporter subunit D [Acidimicrobiales bacterium]
MSVLVVLPVVLPIVGAALSILLGGSRPAQRAVVLTVLGADVVMAAALLVEVDRHGPVAVQAGGWPAPVGVTFVADRFSAMMALVAAVMLLAVLVYAIGQPGAERNHVGFQSVYLVMAAGVSAAFLTGDLFNLFVSIEMMLTASYVLITLGGRLDQVRSGMTYVVVSLVASVLFVALLALVYASTGTVNMADLAGRIAELPDGLRSALAVLMLVVFGIKAAIFPLYFWLPDSYPTAPSPVTAILAGLLTKVGVYAIIRTQTLLFPAETRPATLLLVLAAATMLVGVLGAIAQGDVKRILSFQIVSHIGYMVMGLGLFTVSGLAAAVLYTVHHIVAKTGLFLTGGLIEHAGGSSRLTRLGGMVRSAPVLAVLFLVPALSLVGIPPLSGFIAKLALVDAAAASSSYAVMAVSLVVSLLTLYSLMKIWISVFWSPATEPLASPPDRAHGEHLGGPLLMVVPTAVLAGLTVAMGLAAGPLYDLSMRAAQDLLDPSAYLTAVAP